MSRFLLPWSAEEWKLLPVTDRRYSHTIADKELTGIQKSEEGKTHIYVP